MKHNIHIAILSSLLIVFFSIFTSCSKVDNIQEGEKLTIKFTIAGITEEIDKTSSLQPLNSNVAIEDQKWIGNVGIHIVSEESSINHKSSNYLNNKSHAKNKIAADVSMTSGVKYRILIYYKNTSTLVHTVQGTAGSLTEIVVERNKDYTYYAYSYNDEDNIPNVSNTTNPEITPSMDKDFLFATADFSTSTASQPVYVVFKHKFAEIKMEINTEGMYGVVSDLQGTISTNLYSGTFDFFSNDYTSTSIYNPGQFTFTNRNGLADDSVKVVTLKTVTPVSSYAISINNMHVEYVNTQIDNFPELSSTPKNITFGNFSNLVLGKQFIGKVKIWKNIPQKLILHVSINQDYGFAAGQKASRNMLDETKNFGTLSSSHVKCHSFIHELLTTYGANQLTNRLNSIILDKPDIIVIAVHYLLSASDQTALVDYVEDGGVVVLMTDAANGSGEWTPHLNIIKELFSNPVPVLTMTPVNGAGALYKFANINDIIMNGPFGDIRNLHWGEDSSVSISIQNVPSKQAIIYSNALAENNVILSPPQGVTMFRHNALNFFWIGDGGFLANFNPSGIILPLGYTTQPFATDPISLFPIPKLNYGYAGTALYGATITTLADTDVYNSTLFANVMAWAVYQSEYFGINTP